MYVNTKQNTLVALQKTSTCVYVLSFTSKQSSFQLFLVDLLIISPAVDMDFFLLPLEWWEDGSTGFPPEAWEPDPTHFDGHTVCANCGFILNGKVVAHYFAEPTSMNHPPRPSLWGLSSPTRCHGFCWPQRHQSKQIWTQSTLGNLFAPFCRKISFLCSWISCHDDASPRGGSKSLRGSIRGGSLRLHVPGWGDKCTWKHAISFKRMRVIHWATDFITTLTPLWKPLTALTPLHTMASLEPWSSFGESTSESPKVFLSLLYVPHAPHAKTFPFLCDSNIWVRVYFSGPTFLFLAEISLDRGVPPS